MEEKINIIQFIPYFPPHKGGVETHAQEWADNWSKKGYGKVINITTNIGTEYEGRDKIFKIEEDNGKITYYLPSIEIISNFPVYKLWNKEVRKLFRELKQTFKQENYFIITRTRFFLTSLIGGLFARRPHPTPLLGEERGQGRIKWIHIEHGSDYVKLNSKIKSFIAYIYDKILGKWILKKTDLVIPISSACKNFVLELGGSKIKLGSVIYRGVNLKKINIKKEGDIKLIFIGRLVKLKGVDDLLEVYKNLGVNNELIIIGDGEEMQNLQTFAKKNKVESVRFLGFKNKDFIEKFLAENNCILINPSYQEGLPTTVIEGLFYKNMVVASNVGGTSEISNKKDLILFESGNKKELEEKIKFTIKNYEELKGLSFEDIKEKFDWGKNIKKYYLEFKKLNNG